MSESELAAADGKPVTRIRFVTSIWIHELINLAKAVGEVRKEQPLVDLARKVEGMMNVDAGAQAMAELATPAPPPGPRAAAIEAAARGGIPLKPGYYWAKWKIPSEGTHEGEELCPSSNWEMVQVNANRLGWQTDPTDDEALSVSVPGVREVQWRDCFFWGDYVCSLEHVAALDAPAPPAAPDAPADDRATTIETSCTQLFTGIFAVNPDEDIRMLYPGPSGEPEATRTTWADTTGAPHVRTVTRYAVGGNWRPFTQTFECTDAMLAVWPDVPAYRRDPYMEEIARLQTAVDALTSGDRVPVPRAELAELVAAVRERVAYGVWVARDSDPRLTAAADAVARHMGEGEVGR